MSQRTHESSNFYVWILKQVNVDSPVGDLAKVVKKDPFFPRAGSTIKPFKDYLIQKSGESYFIQALEEAWKEYSELTSS
ncbi:YozE family protein [Thiomicrorhabdus sp. ZW0627]|uniref:YozE family protein n=1 Tax=Thiomicrorhabdus sp. ZW0627 TaxID=3039774 RepID=UPI002436690E|nr:YozE family protein [Thiomicrorhabdus sp. ZW0627]MDG6774618.1 YozE family protein [Thiomicrorhabdus sp. ZW0627]